MGAVYLVRHGQASFGRSDYDRLSATGIEQARVLGAALGRRLARVDAVYCGSMVRHQQTAEHCLRAMDLAPGWAEEPGWNEYDHKEVIERYEPRYASHARMVADMAKGLNPRRQFQEMFSNAVARWTGGAHDAEYTETWTGFVGRIEATLEATVADLGPSRTALVFTSGGAITVVCRKLLHIPDRDVFRLNWTIANASVTKLIYGRSGIHLSTLNEHSHFEGGNEKLITYR